MWLFTRYGFFSAVRARAVRGAHAQALTGDALVIRARLRTHLEALKARFPDLLGSAEIVSHAGTDYAYRIVVEEAVWSETLSRLAQDIDYTNFKSEVARRNNLAGEVYEDSLHQVWAVMLELQRNEI